jgi:hypothetical protein
MKVTPAGRAPVKLRVDFGTVFSALIVKVLELPTTKVVLLALTILGELMIVSVKFCVAGGFMPFDAVSVRT